MGTDLRSSRPTCETYATQENRGGGKVDAAGGGWRRCRAGHRAAPAGAGGRRGRRPSRGRHGRAAAAGRAASGDAWRGVAAWRAAAGPPTFGVWAITPAMCGVRAATRRRRPADAENPRSADPAPIGSRQGRGERDRGPPVGRLTPDPDDLARPATALTESAVVEGRHAARRVHGGPSVTSRSLVGRALRPGTWRTVPPPPSGPASPISRGRVPPTGQTGWGTVGCVRESRTSSPYRSCTQLVW